MTVDMINRLYNTIPESHNKPLSLYIEGNDWGKPDFYFKDAQTFLSEVQSGKKTLKYVWPGVCAFTSPDPNIKAGKEVPLGLLREGEVRLDTPFDTVVRVGIPTTHTNKVANMRRLGKWIDASLIRFHSLFFTIRTSDAQSDKAAAITIRDKFFSQLYAFKVTRTLANNEKFSGKDDGCNDDVVMVLSFLVSCVAATVV